MPDITLCANYETCDYAGKCDRHPDTYIMISDRQSWQYFKGTDECPAAGATDKDSA